MKKEIFTRKDCHDEENWLNERKFGIGGSSCSCIIGRNPYKTNVDYYKEKIGLPTKNDDISNYNNVIYGKKAEEHVRAMFKLDYQNVLEVYHKEFELLIRKDKPFIRSSLDGELLVIQDCVICGKELKQGMRGILEIKTTEPMRSISMESWKDDNVPDNYHCQRLHYLMTTDYDFHILRCDFRAYYKETSSWKHWTKDYCILKDEVKDQMEYLEMKEEEFWNENIQKKKEPNLILNI